MRVGYKLYREVRDFAPNDWTHAELVVALMIADDANEDTRRSWIANPLLCQRARVTERGLRGALQRLGAAGYEFRVAHGYDKNGNPVYAARGHAVDYAVPDMIKGGTVVPPKPVDNHAPGPPKGGTVVPPNDPKGGTRRSEGGTATPPIGAKGGTVVPPLSSEEQLPHKQNSTPKGPDLTGPVENGRARSGQAPMSSIERAAYQAAAERLRRERQETQ